MRRYRLSQMLQQNGLSPVWMRAWRVRWLCLEKVLGHLSHCSRFFSLCGPLDRDRFERPGCDARFSFLVLGPKAEEPGSAGLFVGRASSRNEAQHSQARARP